ncbi:YihY/virulence factor BrkB family protein [Cyclobacterium plantarum]|uniref:YihY/virulence factor BrkB family protein n=1 Tax=Cyclobacterium plantarum TaxID=2716263 RepID=A0ABX0H920_9BACT|nr:YihY/virulence factor BrkB family protein [Cyclobacterium plantarum]NHE56912.1 YihY/virulence factor BrkB family protein [Cyclobacterium plantarum]
MIRRKSAQLKKPGIFKIVHLPGLFWKAAKIWNDNNPWRLGAVVAYYAVLSLPGLLIIIINTVGAFWGKEIVEGQITGEISEALGADAAYAVIAIIENTQKDGRTLFATIFGIAVLVFGATGVFYQLQISMNEIWGVKIDPKAGYWKIIKDRALSLAFVMAIAFLLIISFVISTALTLVSTYLARLWEPGYVEIAYVLEFLFSTGVLGGLFVLIFKFMPDMRVRWQSVWLGGFITAFLFNLGKILLSLYFGIAEPGSTYGAAGSVVLVLLWVSYSCLILFYGAAFTRVYAEKYGPKLHPEDHAMIVENKEVIIERGRKSS